MDSVMPLSVLPWLCIGPHAAAPLGAAALLKSKFDQIDAGQGLPLNRGDLPVNPGQIWKDERGGPGWSALYPRRAAQRALARLSIRDLRLDENLLEPHLLVGLRIEGPNRPTSLPAA
jgi:hypothetical protein